MTSVDLTQAEADHLLAMEKHRSNEEQHGFPLAGGKAALPLHSADKREQFLLDLSRGRIDLKKVTMQTRGRQIITLARLDLAGAPHRNPDGQEIPTPHLHRYRAGFGDKWAEPLPAETFTDPDDLRSTFDEFMRFCNITRPPLVTIGMF